VDPASGRLSYVSTLTTEPSPRGFNIDPSGRFLVAAGQKSDTVSLYAIAPQDGSLRLVGKAPSGKGANWVNIVTTE
jgi:6-phosphogluconolactonase